MPYEIYWGAGSSYSWRVLLALELMDLPYESKLLEFSKNEHQSAEILAMNPRGRLPILKDGDVSIYESIAILAYLDCKHPEKNLFGSNAYEKGKVWQKICEIENYLRDPIYDVVAPVFFDDVENNIETMEKSAANIRAEFKTLEEIFRESDYIAGNSITAADIALLPAIQSLCRAMTFKSAAKPNLKLDRFEKDYPQISSWLKRIEMIPGYEKTYPPNWND